MGASQEEVVKDFVRELYSIFDTRPPVSKAKMMSITKAALRAIKFYKHVVMNVEKFIIKCKPEYKIPGLYVIDSVIRQSRHQYGVEKDVFGSRFAKNILITLEHVEKCPSDDKSKISRVLNLWEKNAIFPPDLIKQMFEAHGSTVNTDLSSSKADSTTEKDSVEKVTGAPDFQRFRELQETLKRTTVKTDTEATSILTEIQQITNQLLESQKKSSTNVQSSDEPSSTTTSITHSTEQIQSNIAHVLDDFDYGSDHDDDEENETHTKPTSTTTGSTTTTINTTKNPLVTIPSTAQINYNQPPPSVFLNTNQANPMSFSMIDPKSMSLPMGFDPSRPPPLLFQQQFSTSIQNPLSMNFNSARQGMQPPLDVDLRPEDMEADNNDDQNDSRRSPSPRHSHYNRRRSRSRSGSRSRETKRNRSSSNSNSRRDSAASRLQETEKRERQRKGLPPLKQDHLVVTSRTLWLGHLSKTTTEADLKEELDPYGEITDINHIISRGCAFVCFKERADAFRCLEKMRDVRFHGNPIKIAWATNKGVKDRFKLYWDPDHGCTYIPYSELKEVQDLKAIAEGGTIDEESIPPFLKAPVMQTNMDMNSIIAQQQASTLIQAPPGFSHSDFQSAMNSQPSASTTVHLDQAGRLTGAPAILMTSHQEPTIRVGLPVQMMPPGTQIIQVQSHPHPSSVQMVQRIPGAVFPNGQIIHQVPFSPVISSSQPPPSMSIQHRPGEFKDLGSQAIHAGGGLHILTNATGVPTHRHFLTSTTPIVTGATTISTANFAQNVEGAPHIQYHSEPHHRLTSTPPNSAAHFDEHHRSHLSKTDEQLIQLSNQPSLSSNRFSTHPPPVIGRPALPPSPLHLSQPHGNQFGTSGNVQNMNPVGMVSTPTKNADERQNASPYTRRPNRFEAREDTNVSQDMNNNYGTNRGVRNSFNDRNNLNNNSRPNNRGRGTPGSGHGGSRGYYNNNMNNPGSVDDRNNRTDNNDNQNPSYRGHGGYNRGVRGNSGNGASGQSRFYSRGLNNRGSHHDHSSSHSSSSHSPDHHSSSYRHDHHQSKYASTSRGYSSSGPSHDFSHRHSSIDSSRKTEKTNNDSSWNDSNNNSNQSSSVMNENLSNRSGPTE